MPMIIVSGSSAGAQFLKACEGGNYDYVESLLDNPEREFGKLKRLRENHPHFTSCILGRNIFTEVCNNMFLHN